MMSLRPQETIQWKKLRPNTHTIVFECSFLVYYLQIFLQATFLQTISIIKKMNEYKYIELHFDLFAGSTPSILRYIVWV